MDIFINIHPQFSKDGKIGSFNFRIKNSNISKKKTPNFLAEYLTLIILILQFQQTRKINAVFLCKCWVTKEHLILKLIIY